MLLTLLLVGLVVFHVLEDYSRYKKLNILVFSIQFFLEISSINHKKVKNKQAEC